MLIQKIYQEYQLVKKERGSIVDPNWQVVEVKGADREKFLNNMLSQNIAEQPINQRKWACLLTNKGKLIGFFQVWKLKDRCLLVMHQSQSETVMKTLDMYALADDVTFSKLTDIHVIFIFGNSSGVANQIEDGDEIKCTLDDFSIPCTQVLSKKQNTSGIVMSPELFESIRVQSGFPIPQKDYEDPLPLEVPFMVKGVAFQKGCYVGQETVNRVWSRGMNVSKKLLRFSCGIDSTIEIGNLVFSEGSEVGKVTSLTVSPTTDQRVGLAWIHRNAFDKPATVNNQVIEIQYE
jgi:folate-binding protein YgfZ